MSKRLLTAALVAALSLFSALTWAADPVNINTASAEQIAMTLKGVGPAKAQAIVEYREEKGEFVSVDELTQVRGIGPATLEQNRAFIVIDDAESSQ